VPSIDGEHPHLTKQPLTYWTLASRFGLLVFALTAFTWFGAIIQRDPGRLPVLLVGALAYRSRLEIDGQGDCPHH
jgi:hypothetical protein